MQERLQKIISAAGVASRRAAEDLILEGRVRVNGKVVTELGSKADPEKDHIKVDGKLINPRQPKAYLMLNKPAGYVTTLSDPEGRPTVQDLLKGVKARVYPVGRLDYNTEGLLLLTNDGDFAHLIMHPRHELPKTYLVKIKGVLTDETVNKLESGVYLKDGKTAPARVKRLRKEEANSWVEVTIHEGKKRQVRRMIDHVGHSVIRLKRVRVGNLPLGNLPPGAYRYLTPEEVKGLRDLAEGKIRETRDETKAVRREAVGVRGKARGARDEGRERTREAAGGRGKARGTWGGDKAERREAIGERGRARRTREEGQERQRRRPFDKLRTGPGDRETRGRITAGERGKARVTSDEGRGTKSRAEGVRSKASEKRDEERWTSNKPFGERGNIRGTWDERRGTKSRTEGVKRKTDAHTWWKPGAGRQRSNERKMKPAGSSRRPLR
jgi:23S rRNA pseudouridine2605 synthase